MQKWLCSILTSPSAPTASDWVTAEHKLCSHSLLLGVCCITARGVWSIKGTGVLLQFQSWNIYFNEKVFVIVVLSRYINFSCYSHINHTFFQIRVMTNENTLPTVFVCLPRDVLPSDQWWYVCNIFSSSWGFLIGWRCTPKITGSGAEKTKPKQCCPIGRFSITGNTVCRQLFPYLLI